MKLVVRKRTILLIVFCIILGSFISYKLFDTFKSNNKPWIVANADQPSKKFITKDALIKKIDQKQKLITTEVEISAKATIDNSWGNLSIFKKLQNISFTAKGTYIVDLSNLKSKNISLDLNHNSLTLKIAKPKVDTIEIDDSKTVYETTEKGLLRFGDIELTPQDHELMLEKVKKEMNEKMLEKKYFDKALDNSKKSIKSLVNSLINTGNSNYLVNIEFF